MVRVLGPVTPNFLAHRCTGTLNNALSTGTLATFHFHETVWDLFPASIGFFSGSSPRCFPRFSRRAPLPRSPTSHENSAGGSHGEHFFGGPACCERCLRGPTRKVSHFPPRAAKEEVRMPTGRQSRQCRGRQVPNPSATQSLRWVWRGGVGGGSIRKGMAAQGEGRRGRVRDRDI